MKRIFLPLLLLILPFVFIKNAYALDAYCWNPNTGEYDPDKYTDEYGCGSSYCYDDDGISPYCVKTPIGGTIHYYSSYNGNYPMGELSNVNGFYAQQGYSDVKFEFNVPVWSKTIMNSITVSGKGDDGVTQWHDGLVPMSYDYCSDANFIQNTGNFNGMYFDGYDKLPIDSMEVPNASGYCYRVYVRMKVRIFYFLPNQVNAVPIAESGFYYMSSFDNVFMQFYNNFGFDSMIAINNLQYYVHNDYIKILDEIDYRNYLYNIHEIQQDFQQSQDTYIQDIRDILLSTEDPDTGNLNNSVGWLPPGPVDSLLNLPLSMLTNLHENLHGTCYPLSLPLPFVNKDLTVPCVTQIYSQINGLSVLLNTIGIITSAFMLYKYLLNLYKWVDDTLTFKENNMIDNWGGF